ncbi:MAG: metallophosphoesterase family protein [Terriglobales bacterium]
MFGQTAPVEIGLSVKLPFRFVGYGDTRFTNPIDSGAANPAARVALVNAIADAHPSFISIGGDLVYNGYDPNDWNMYDEETEPWKQANIPVYPALGNHDLHGNSEVALANYFHRFPDLQGSRYYSIRAANSLMLVLDSAQDEISGPQGEWLTEKLDTLPADVGFVFVVLHHPPYTRSSDTQIFRGGGHSARHREKELAEFLESRQQQMRARIIVFAGHVHNYERFEHGGVTYFVTGGGGATPYHIPRSPDDPLHDYAVNYHYLVVEVESDSVKITMNRLEFVQGKPRWSQPDKVTIKLPSTSKAGAK